MNKHQYHAVLEDWTMFPNNRLYGAIFNDETKRFPEGAVVTTSTVNPGQHFVEGAIVETRNTRYLLGKRASGSFDDGHPVQSTRYLQIDSLCAYMADLGYSIIYSTSSVFFRNAKGDMYSFAAAVRYHNRAHHNGAKLVVKVKLQRTNNRIVVQSHKVEYINKELAA